GRPEARPVAAVQSTRDGQGAPSRGLPVRAGEHREHARPRLGPARVRRADAAMGLRRTHHVGECPAWQDDVAHIAARAPKKTPGLEPGDALANREFTHLISSESRRRWHFYRKAAAGWLPGPSPWGGRSSRTRKRRRTHLGRGIAAVWPLDFARAVSAQ